MGCDPTSAPSQGQTPHTPAAFKASSRDFEGEAGLCRPVSGAGGAQAVCERAGPETEAHISGVPSCFGTSEKEPDSRHCWKAAGSSRLVLSPRHLL